MRVLVACEFSATVRNAFRERGHDAWSVDLLPTEGDPRWHRQGDALAMIREGGWDLVIAHPPCQYLCLSGVRWLYEQPGRMAKMREAALFFRAILNSDAPRIAVENSRMHRRGQEIVGRNYDQVVQPYEHGHLESKGVALWLRGLPKLAPTKDVKAETMALTPRERDRAHWVSPGPDRWKARSRTYPGIAAAMAEQWGTS